MVNQTVLADHLAEYLSVSEFKDYCPNGLQVQGCTEIKRVMTGVSASLKLIEKAIEWKADALVVHHGYFWKGESPCLVGSKYKRIARLVENGINLYAYHLPLDCHLQLGNNAQIGALLELGSLKRHTVDGVRDLLWTGELSKEYTGSELNRLLSVKLGQEPLYLPSASEQAIKSLAWCSGAAHRYLPEAKSLGADAFITGEVSEQTFHQADEEDIHFFGCGHHATERYGVKALGQYLSQQFGLTHQFCDIPNPI